MTGIATKSNAVIVIGGATATAATRVTAVDWATENQIFITVCAAIGTVGCLLLNTLWSMYKGHRELKEQERHNREMEKDK